MVTKHIDKVVRWKREKADGADSLTKQIARRWNKSAIILSDKESKLIEKVINCEKSGAGKSTYTTAFFWNTMF